MATATRQRIPNIESPGLNPRRIELTEADRQQVRAALNSIEAAQLLIDEARRQLCPVIGFGDQWSDLANAHAAVKSSWHEVSDRLGQLTPTKLQ